MTYEYYNRAKELRLKIGIDNPHWDYCCSKVLSYSEDLWDKVGQEKLNESAVEGLITSYLEKPAFYVEWRPELLRMGMALGGDPKWFKTEERRNDDS